MTTSGFDALAYATQWANAWVNEYGHIRPGILGATLAGWRQALAIMDAAPTRYPAVERDDMRAAITYITDRFDATGRPAA